MWSQIGSYEDFAGSTVLTDDFCILKIKKQTINSNGENEYNLELASLSENFCVKWSCVCSSYRIIDEHDGKLFIQIDQGAYSYLSSSEGLVPAVSGYANGYFLDEVHFLGNDENDRSVSRFSLRDNMSNWKYSLQQDEVLAHRQVFASMSGLIPVFGSAPRRIKILCPSSGEVLWELIYPDRYNAGSPIGSGDFCLFLFISKDAVRFPDYSTYRNRKLIIANRWDGGVVAEYDDVPGNNHLFWFDVTDTVFLSGGRYLYKVFENGIYSLEVIDITEHFDDSSLCIAGIVGKCNDQLVLHLSSLDQTRTGAIALYDVRNKVFTHLQYMEVNLPKKIRIEAKKGFLFVYLLDRQMHVFKWTDA